MILQKITLFLFALALSFTVQAQMSPVREMDKTMSFGTRPCFRVEFRGADKDLVSNLWKKFAKERFSAKLKKDKKTDEWFAPKLSGSISPSEYTLRSTIEEINKNDAALNVWFDLGSSFLNRREHAQSADEAVSALSDFYVEVRREVVTRELKEAEKKMKDMEAAKRKMEKENDNLHKDIEEYKAKIKKAEEDIKKNEQEQNSNVADQEAQRRLIEEIRIRLQNVGSEKN
ncbi:MAG: hypothetical protein RIR11_3099 [Bacteroidota bacterium]|jgi:chromosome segregation ATPase